MGFAHEPLAQERHTELFQRVLLLFDAASQVSGLGESIADSLRLPACKRLPRIGASIAVRSDIPIAARGNPHENGPFRRGTPLGLEQNCRQIRRGDTRVAFAIVPGPTEQKDRNRMPRTKKTDSRSVTVRPKANRRVVDRAPQPAVAPTDIARLAYEIFESRGRTHGAELDDWLEAERRLSNGVGA
jgi:Protein of unknown function (DUF2934)